MSSKNNIVAPIRFKPVFKEKIWGGVALRDKLGKTDMPNSPHVGESWEISGWGDSQTVVLNGEHAGVTLGKLFAQDLAALAGSAYGAQKTFPLLFKFIDAKDDLSIQVHPNCEQAAAHGWGERGKTEAWYVVDAKPNARIVLGFNRAGITREEAAAAVREGRFETLLNFVPARAGDTFFIPPGTVHAILGGTLIYEIQEESNTTLRLYDWNRKGRSGTMRELHIDSALDIIDFSQVNPVMPPPSIISKSEDYIYETLCENSKFVLSRYRFLKRGKSVSLAANDKFHVLAVTAGAAKIIFNGDNNGDDSMVLNLGQTVLVPATLDNVKIESVSDKITDVLVT